MGLLHSPKVVTDGLVFYYDMGNQRKSWKGAPTTNIVTNWNLDTGWSKNYCTDIIFNEIEPPPGVDAPTVGFRDADGSGSGYWYSYGNYAPGQTPGSTMTVSLYVKVIGPSCVIRCYTADNSETGRVYGSQITVSEPEGWKRCVWTVTIPNPSQSESLSFVFDSFPPTSRMWLCAPQMETGSFATPFVKGTRTNTQAIVDLTGNNTVTATSLTYASDGSFSFNGSSNYISTSSAVSAKTIIAWCKLSTAAGGDYVIYGLDANGADNWFSINANKAYAYATQSSDVNNFGVTGTTTLNTTNYYQLCCTIDTNTVKVYVNGAEEASSTQAFTIGSWNTAPTIGRRGSLAQRYFPGNIDLVSVYNRVLTATEIRQNFNALRSRYGI